MKFALMQRRPRPQKASQRLSAMALRFQPPVCATPILTNTLDLFKSIRLHLKHNKKMDAYT